MAPLASSGFYFHDNNPQNVRRRTFVTVTAGITGIAGCPFRQGDSSSSPETSLPTHRRTDDVETSFEILEVYPPTPTSRPVTVSFEDSRVIVTGTIAPDGCREPVLQSSGYEGSTDVVRLVLGTDSMFGPSPTAVCESGIYRYRCAVSVENGTPATVKVVYDLHEKQDRTFVRERE